MLPFLRRYGLNLLIILMLGVLIFRYFQRQPRFVQGERAPDFGVALMSGDSFRLSDYRGHYMLVHFWGSWCGPCRKENPGWTALYDEFGDRPLDKDTYFHILSIGIETNPEAWARAVQKDRLRWPMHYADFERFGGELARLYGVREIPTSYLIDPRGYIIGVNKKPEEVGKMLRGLHK